MRRLWGAVGWVERSLKVCALVAFTVIGSSFPTHGQENKDNLPSWLADRLTVAMNSADEELRIFTLHLANSHRWFEHWSQSPSAIENPITTFLASKKPAIVIGALRALAALQAKDQIDKIVALLDNSNSDVQVAAIKALAKLQAQDRIDKITPFLNNLDRDLKVQVSRR